MTDVGGIDEAVGVRVALQQTHCCGNGAAHISGHVDNVAQRNREVLRIRYSSKIDDVLTSITGIDHPAAHASNSGRNSRVTHARDWDRELKDHCVTPIRSAAALNPARSGQRQINFERCAAVRFSGSGAHKHGRDFVNIAVPNVGDVELTGRVLAE